MKALKERFAKIINGLTVSGKRIILDVWQGSQYVFVR